MKSIDILQIIFFIDVVLIKIELVLKDSSDVVIENLVNEFIVDEFFLESDWELFL